MEFCGSPNTEPVEAQSVRDGRVRYAEEEPVMPYGVFFFFHFFFVFPLFVFPVTALILTAPAFLCRNLWVRG